MAPPGGGETPPPVEALLSWRSSAEVSVFQRQRGEEPWWGGISYSLAGFCGTEVAEHVIESAAVFSQVQELREAVLPPSRDPRAYRNDDDDDDDDDDDGAVGGVGDADDDGKKKYDNSRQLALSSRSATNAGDLDPTSSYALAKELVAFSEKYRESLAKCGGEVLDRAEALRAAGVDPDIEVEKFLATIDLLGKVWHLCDIFLLEPEAALPSPSLATFLRQNFGQETDSKLREREAWLEMAKDRPELGQWYRDLLLGLLKAGEMERAARVLRCHGEYVEGGLGNPAYVLCELVEAKPSAWDGTRRQFETDWNRWRDRCSRALKTIGAGGDSALADSCRLLLGEPSVLDACCASWDELMCARLLYVCPCISRGEVRALADECRRLVPESSDSGDGSHEQQQQVMVEVVLRMMSEEAGQVVPVFSSAGNDLVSAAALAHVVDLLCMRGALHDDVVPEALGGVQGLRDRLLLEVSEKLFSMPRGWEPASQYLYHCSTPCGRDAMHALMQRLSPSSERECAVYVAFCQSVDLWEEALVACRVRARYWMGKGVPGAAAHWLFLCKDGQMLGGLCARVVQDMMDKVERFLLRSEEGGGGGVGGGDRMSILNDVCEDDGLTLLQDACARAESVLSAVPSNDALSLTTELEFLQHYKDMVDAILNLRDLQGYSDIAGRLEAMLSCGIAPQRAWPHLLHFVLLTCRRGVPGLYNVSQVATLLECLNQVETSRHLRPPPECVPYQENRNDGSPSADLSWLEDLRVALRQTVHQALLNSNKSQRQQRRAVVGVGPPSLEAESSSTGVVAAAPVLPSARSLLYG